MRTMRRRPTCGAHLREAASRGLPQLQPGRRASWHRAQPVQDAETDRPVRCAFRRRDADVTGANPIFANMATANLRDAILVRADLSNANLSGADFTGANIYGTVLRAPRDWRR